MRTESWRLSRGHHMWRHKGIFLFYKELKEQKSGSLSTDPFSKTGSHGLMSQSLFEIRTFIWNAVFYAFLLLWAVIWRVYCMFLGDGCLWYILCCLRPSVFVCPVRSFVAEAVPSPPQGYAPVVHSFADTAAPSLAYMPTLHVVG